MIHSFLFPYEVDISDHLNLSNSKPLLISLLQTAASTKSTLPSALPPHPLKQHSTGDEFVDSAPAEN